MFFFVISLLFTAVLLLFILELIFFTFKWNSCIRIRVTDFITERNLKYSIRHVSPADVAAITNTLNRCSRSYRSCRQKCYISAKTMRDCCICSICVCTYRMCIRKPLLRILIYYGANCDRGVVQLCKWKELKAWSYSSIIVL